MSVTPEQIEEYVMTNAPEVRIKVVYPNGNIEYLALREAGSRLDKGRFAEGTTLQLADYLGGSIHMTWVDISQYAIRGRLIKEASLAMSVEAKYVLSPSTEAA